MSRRYSLVNRGLEFKTALDNRQAYLTDPARRTTKRMSGGVRSRTLDLNPAAVKPFGKDMGAAYASCRLSTEASTNIGSTVSTRIFTQGAQLAAAEKLAGFKPAKVNVFKGTGAASYVQSKITRLYYLKYAGDSYSAPFGATTEAEEYAAGAAVVKAAIAALFASSDVLRISFSPEKVPV